MTGAVVCSLLFWSGSQVASAQDGQQDLQGILPDYIPNGLGESDFNQLGGKWADWGSETGRLVTDFYTSDDDEVRGRRQTLEQIQKKLQTMERALGDSRYMPIYGPLADLHGRLSRRMAVAEALLPTLEQDVSQLSPSRVHSTMSKLAGAGRSLQSYLQSINGGNRWVDYLNLDKIVSNASGNDTSDEAISLLDDVSNKLADREKFSDEQQAFLARPPVQRFADALGQATQLLSATDPEARQQQMRDLAANLMSGIDDYESEPTTENAANLRRLFDDLRRLTPDGAAALTAAMRKHYLNYNLRVVVDESLLRDVARDSQVGSGFINEMVSRAHVTGCQWSNTTVNLDLKPSYQGIRFNLNLNGNVRSSVAGSTHMATVHASGQFHINGQKQVVFDGERFSTWPAQVNVGGGTRPYAARTRVSWIPLIGRIAENRALSEASDPQNSQYARNKVYQESRSRFDRESADLLRRAEQRLEREVTGPLRRENYYPDVRELHSTETKASMRTRLMSAGEIGGGDTLPLPIDPAHGALVQLHESLLNQVGRRLDLEGKRFTPDQLEQYLKHEMQQIAGRSVDLSGLSRPQESADSPKVEEIIFDDADALRFRVTGGEVILQLSMGLKLEGRDEIEPQRITVPLKFSLAGNRIHMERGTVGVSPIGQVAPGDRAQQIARSGVMRQKIQEAFEPQDFDGWYDLNFEGKSVRLYVTDLRARGGWLSLVATNGVGSYRAPGQTLPTPIMQQVHLTAASPTDR